MKNYFKRKNIYIVIIIIGILIALFSLIRLYFIVLNCVLGRESFNTPIPFYVGGTLALIFGVWPPSRFFSGWKTHVIRALIFTLFMAPVPFGPEGTLFPSILSVFYPVLLFDFPQGFILTFIIAICLSRACPNTDNLLPIK